MDGWKTIVTSLLGQTAYFQGRFFFVSFRLGIPVSHVLAHDFSYVLQHRKRWSPSSSPSSPGVTVDSEEVCPRLAAAGWYAVRVQPGTNTSWCLLKKKNRGVDGQLPVGADGQLSVGVADASVWWWGFFCSWAMEKGDDDGCFLRWGMTYYPRHIGIIVKPL